METHDFKCRLCATRWLAFTENNIPCSSSLHEDRRHNFDFRKPIKVEGTFGEFGIRQVDLRL